MLISRLRHKRHVEGDFWAPGLPLGIRIIALARTVRWVGWGFGESLIPIFIFSFVGTFAEAGLLKSVFEISLLFCLPFIGALADRLSARLLILVGIATYFFVGASYLLAGVTGLAVFIILARFTNAVGWALENTGVETYYRRLASEQRLASSFGFIDTVAESGWIAAALIGIVLVQFFPVHWLLFLITPFAMAAFFIARSALADRPKVVSERKSLMRSYQVALLQWKEWGGDLRLLGALVFFMGLVEAFMWFFLPIDAFLGGASPVFVILITLVAALPVTFGYALGVLADRTNKYLLMALGLLAVALVLVCLALFPQYWVKLVASFALGTTLELFSVIQKTLVTTLGPAAQYGIRGSTFASIGDLGDIAAPLLLGIVLDAIGFPSVAIMVAWAAIFLSLSFTALGFKRRKKS